MNFDRVRVYFLSMVVIGLGWALREGVASVEFLGESVAAMGAQARCQPGDVIVKETLEIIRSVRQGDSGSPRLVALAPELVVR